MPWLTATVSNPPESASAGRPRVIAAATSSSMPSRSWIEYWYSSGVRRRSAVRWPPRPAMLASVSAACRAASAGWAMVLAGAGVGGGGADAGEADDKLQVRHRRVLHVAAALLAVEEDVDHRVVHQPLDPFVTIHIVRFT